MKKILLTLFICTISFSSAYSKEKSSNTEGLDGFISHIKMQVIDKHEDLRKCLKKAKNRPNKPTKVRFVLEVKDQEPYRAGVYSSDYPVATRACIINVLWSIKITQSNPVKEIIKIEIPLILKN